ncbi:MAG: class II fructose-bisphosphate aldolase [Oscillospiraceae bacterium]|jgi:fructose-bisphosphate aldolase class II|nr:class II fructose-bisphosphate aldolase [Oscillospiraceae bacterium]
MLVTLKEILRGAAEKGYAVGMFNMLNLETARGIVEAAREERSPVILGVAQVHLPYVPFEYASLIMRKLAAEADVPVCLHFDHGTDLEAILAAARGGFSSVMYDGSALPYEENARRTREVVEALRGLPVSVEAELGHVGGGGEIPDGTRAADYTDPAQVCDFIRRTGVDALAVAVGTAHGHYARPPVLNLELLAQIHRISEKPLVLHGGSGLSDADFTRSIQNGIRKVNICTELCAAAHRAYADAYARGQSFEPTVTEAKDAVREVVRQRLRLFGSANAVR